MVFRRTKRYRFVQKLYETHKFITYPHTGSRYISDDVFDEIPELINSLISPQCPKSLSTFAQSMENTPLNKRSVNSAKVTDHHALLITGNQPKELTEDEQTIYTMVAGRMLESSLLSQSGQMYRRKLRFNDFSHHQRKNVIRQANHRFADHR